MAGHAFQHPFDITPMVAGQPEFAAVGQRPGQFADGFIGNEAPPVVPFFRPWIGKKGIDPADGSLGQTGKKLSRVIVENANVGQAFAFDPAQQAGNAIDEGLAADEPDVGTGPGLGRQVFPGAEADLEPDIGNGGFEGARKVQGSARGREFQAQTG